MRRVHFLLLPAFMLFIAVGLAQEREREEREPEEDDPKARVPQYLQDYKRKGLAPIGDRIEFEDRHAFPPRPKGLRLAEGVKPDVKEISQPSIADLIARSREVALRDVRVKSALGERFALVGGGPSDTSQRSTL
jgi:hypothetical protein